MFKFSDWVWEFWPLSKLIQLWKGTICIHVSYITIFLHTQDYFMFTLKKRKKNKKILIFIQTILLDGISFFWYMIIKGFCAIILQGHYLWFNVHVVKRNCFQISISQSNIKIRLAWRFLHRNKLSISYSLWKMMLF